MLFLYKVQAGTAANQRAESNQSLKGTLEIQAGHHGVADDLQAARVDVPIALEADVRIPGFLHCQRPQAVDDRPVIKRSRSRQQLSIQPCRLTQITHIQSNS
ncbi:hypothetical protein D3C75_1005580 [compost metagenome]